MFLIFVIALILFGFVGIGLVYFASIIWNMIKENEAMRDEEIKKIKGEFK